MAKLKQGDVVYKAAVSRGYEKPDVILVESTTVQDVNRAGGVTLTERKRCWGYAKRLPMEHAGELTPAEAVTALCEELTQDAGELQAQAAEKLASRFLDVVSR